MDDARLKQAVHNNARWCDAVCRAHGCPGTFFDCIWINHHATPPFYPNAVTLADTQRAEAQLASIRDLLAAGIPRSWAVKDSYAVLDLRPLGFHVLFEAQWIWRSPSQPRPADRIAGIRWTKIETASELADWETAWRGDADLSPEPPVPIFVPALLADESVAVFAAYRHHRIVAGAIANRTADAVGLSNVFLPTHDAEHLRAGCLAQVTDAFPGVPVVGYEGGTDLAAAQGLGFEAVGALRVWLKGDTSP